MNAGRPPQGPPRGRYSQYLTLDSRSDRDPVYIAPFHFHEEGEMYTLGFRAKLPPPCGHNDDDGCYKHEDIAEACLKSNPPDQDYRGVIDVELVSYPQVPFKGRRILFVPGLYTALIECITVGNTVVPVSYPIGISGVFRLVDVDGFMPAAHVGQLIKISVKLETHDVTMRQLFANVIGTRGQS